jgi:hypothetical protein
MRGSHIIGNLIHDHGAYGQCQCCHRYSDNPKCLRHDFYCECGKKNLFSGSFRTPNEDSKWLL